MRQPEGSETSDDRGEAEREPARVPDDRPKVHTTPEEGHPAGDGERSDRDIGGPTSPDHPPDEDVAGGAPGTPPDSGFEPHRADDEEIEDEGG